MEDKDQSQSLDLSCKPDLDFFELFSKRKPHFIAYYIVHRTDFHICICGNSYDQINTI